MSEASRLINEATTHVHDLVDTLMDLHPHMDGLTEHECNSLRQLYAEMTPVLVQYLNVLSEITKGAKPN